MTGFFVFACNHFPPSTSALPPISPIITIALVSGSAVNSSSRSVKSKPLTGSPPMPTHVVWPIPRAEHCQTASYVNVPERLMMPTALREGASIRCMWIYPGIIPILHPPSYFFSPTFLPGVITPGQFGPTNVVFGYFFSISRTRIMSCTGMPSVIAQINPIPASAASMIASPAYGGGTKIIVAVAPVVLTASCIVSKIGKPFASRWPPFPGVVPPTI